MENAENVGNVRIGLGANITTERGENIGKQWKTSKRLELELVQTLQWKAAENVGKVGIGTGGNMVHDRLPEHRKSWINFCGA